MKRDKSLFVVSMLFLQGKAGLVRKKATSKDSEEAAWETLRAAEHSDTDSMFYPLKHKTHFFSRCRFNQKDYAWS